jgi:hypothetical protein
VALQVAALRAADSLFDFALRKSPLLAQRTREKWGTHVFYFLWWASAHGY